MKRFWLLEFGLNQSPNSVLKANWMFSQRARRRALSRPESRRGVAAWFGPTRARRKRAHSKAVGWVQAYSGCSRHNGVSAHVGWEPL